MFNTNSPIINNIQTGMQSYGCIPPNPMGNIVNIGNVGYTANGSSGYYNGNYDNRFINPFLYRQQQEEMISQQREEIRRQSDVFKTISKSVHQALGQEITDDQLDKLYNPVFDQPEIDRDEAIYNELTNAQLNGNMINGNIYAIQGILNSNAYVEQRKRQFPDDISFKEYHERAYELVIEAMEDKQREKQQNLNGLYQKSEYTKLINMHSKSSNFFNTILRNQETNPAIQQTTIDDMTTSLPNHLATENMRRKQMFMQSILNG